MSVEKPELARRAIRYSAVNTIIARYGIALALTLAGVSLACAQAPSAVQKPCSELDGDSSKTLSERLDQGSGVICPPNVDPGIKAPTPETGKMPVIPPPGSPGGDPNVKPK
ncbi:MAG TPA: hypothetical protein VFN27_05565 [Xanthobacteraceae bacterium]|nr:hypothetical protein [Xanthobacteraceae bacterium]